MSIAIPCPQCGKLLRIPNASVLGKMGRCPKCEHKFVLREPEPDEVPLELVTTPTSESDERRSQTVKMGVGAEWVPDSPPAPSIPVFAAATESPSRSKRKRKKRPLQQRIAIFAGLVIVGSVLAFAFTTYVLPALTATQPAQLAKKNKKSKATESDPAAATDEAEGTDTASSPSEQKFGRPTRGKPVDLLWIPSGARIVISMRPAELWKAGGKGEGEFIAALGPIGIWMNTRMKEFLKAEPHQIEELLLCVIPGQRGTPPEFAAVVRRTKDHKFLKSSLMEGMTAIDTGPVKYYTDEKWAIAFQPDMVTYSIAPASLAAEMSKAGVEPNMTATEVEELLKFTDRSMHFTMVCIPTDLNIHGEVLVPANALPLLESLRLWISSNDEVEAAAWTFHVGAEKFYSQLMLRNRGLVKPQRLSRTFEAQLASTPQQVLDVIQTMNPSKMGPRKVIGRVPAMVKVVQLGTKFQTDKQLVSMVYEGPERAAPNLALGALLAWDESTRTNFSSRPTTVASALPQKRKPLPELLKTKIDVEFNREPLENAFKFIADEAKFDIYVDGDGLKTAGYTKNMPQTFKVEGITASAALAKIQSAYDKMCFVVDESKHLVTVTVLEKAKANNQKVIVFK